MPASTTALARNSYGTGTAGQGSDGPFVGYQAPCSQGTGTKLYTFTLYALSSKPTLPADPKQVTGPVLAQAIEALTIAKGSLDGAHTTTP